MKRLVLLLLLLLGLLASGCADEKLIATFTSRVVQLETCRVVGDAPEGCAKDESIAEVRTDLVEEEGDAFWLYGLARGGVEDLALLGTRDSVGGFLFVDEVVQSDAATGCVLTDRLQLSLAVDPEVLEADIGTDDCASLVGRQVETTTTTAECDTASVPPQPVQRIVRKRWEPLDESSQCSADTGAEE